VFPTERRAAKSTNDVDPDARLGAREGARGIVEGNQRTRWEHAEARWRSDCAHVAGVANANAFTECSFNRGV